MLTYKDLPKSPGIYKFLNAKGKIIYIGKAKSLRSRVGSYFLNTFDIGTKTHALVSRIVDIQFIETQSELEALILEAELIRKHKPKYNIALKDDKSYLYIVVRGTKLPTVLVARKQDLKKGDKYYGPYANTNTTRHIVRILRKIFPFRDCSTTKFNRHQKSANHCLYGHIGLCSAPCVNNSDKDIREYQNQIKRVKKLLGGEGSQVMVQLKSKMRKASDKQDYEEAAQYRNLIRKFDYVRQDFTLAEDYIKNPYLIEDLAEKSMDEINELLKLPSIPKRIECYDISNISGKEAVGSMVVATNGRIDKSQYRRFKIKLKDTPDDFGMMKEVLERRLNNDWLAPDLIVLDGGKGQLSVVLDLDVNYPVVGLAKRLETIVYKDSKGVFKEVRPDKDSESMKLLISLRDEAHRFAQAYHHKLRLNKIKYGNK